MERLVQLELLERIDDPSDRRQVLVRATPGARERLDRINELGRDRLRELLVTLPGAEDLETIERAIHLLTEAAARQLPDDIEEPR